MGIRTWGIRDCEEAKRVRCAYNQGYYDAVLACIVVVTVTAFLTAGIAYLL